MAHVSVTINGRQYRMACDDGQEHHLARLAHDLCPKSLRLFGIMHLTPVGGDHGPNGAHRLVDAARGLPVGRLELARTCLRTIKVGGKPRPVDIEGMDLVDECAALAVVLPAHLQGGVERVQCIHDAPDGLINPTHTLHCVRFIASFGRPDNVLAVVLALMSAGIEAYGHRQPGVNANAAGWRSSAQLVWTTRRKWPVSLTHRAHMLSSRRPGRRSCAGILGSRLVPRYLSALFEPSPWEQRTN